MDRSVYIRFPRDRTEGNGWDRMVQRYHSAFYAHGIRPYQVLLRLPLGRTYIAPHVQEYLSHLDMACESHLTYYTNDVQSALSNSGQPLPPFPRVERVDQHHDDWDEHRVPPDQVEGPHRHGATPTAGDHGRVFGVGIDPGFDIEIGPDEDDGLLFPPASPTTTPAP